jgi:hypothetical protein
VHTTFYSDSTNDLPCWSGSAHAGGHQPRRAPARHGRSRGWRILDLFPTKYMIKKFIDKLLGKTSARKRLPPSANARKCRSPNTASTRQTGGRTRQTWCRPSSRRGSRPTSWAARCATCWWGCDPRTSTWPPTPRPSRSRAVPPRLHHRAALSHRARGVRPRARARGDRGLDLSRLPGQRRRRTGGGNERTSRSELAGMKHAVDSTGRVLRDNVWGPQEEDAVRRDFTINAMYYDPRRRSWWTTTMASRT